VIAFLWILALMVVIAIVACSLCRVGHAADVDTARLTANLPNLGGSGPTADEPTARTSTAPRAQLTEGPDVPVRPLPPTGTYSTGAAAYPDYWREYKPVTPKGQNLC
jgi:hypothetical protein